jgi:hypothetical protein
MSFVSLYRKWRSPGVMEERLAEIEEKIKDCLNLPSFNL